MRRFLTAILACAILFITLGASAEAYAAPTTKGAKAAVTKKLRHLSDAIDYPSVHCERESYSRFYCSYEGLSDLDVRYGNVEGTSGNATVTYYAGRYVARIF
jgi:hypothetical protein